MSDGGVRIVLDTNVLISWLLLADSVPGRVSVQVIRSGSLLISTDTMNELADVLARRKFDRYVTTQQRKRFLHLIGRSATLVPIIERVQVCRDPKDNKFLELAVNGRAEVLLTGDSDLLALRLFRGITIQSPADYLARL